MISKNIESHISTSGTLLKEFMGFNIKILIIYFRSILPYALMDSSRGFPNCWNFPFRSAAIVWIMVLNVLLACTGSVASIKIPKIIDELTRLQDEVNVKLVTTQNAMHFFNPNELKIDVLTDTEEWESWKKMGDPVLHIELRRWANILVIAPLDANTLAKIANGICDNLLTCIVRAWDQSRPLLFAPAMNTYMWDHPLTTQHIATLKAFGYTELPCIEKLLACGDKGFGAMAEVHTIVSKILEHLTSTSQS